VMVVNTHTLAGELYTPLREVHVEAFKAAL
jgi:hypothetical protein